VTIGTASPMYMSSPYLSERNLERDTGMEIGRDVLIVGPVRSIWMQ
jgi:hypothetical protein